MGSIDGYVFNTNVLTLGLGTGRPGSVDRDDLPQPYSELSSDYSSFPPYGF